MLRYVNVIVTANRMRHTLVPLQRQTKQKRMKTKEEQTTPKTDYEYLNALLQADEKDLLTHELYILAQVLVDENVVNEPDADRSLHYISEAAQHGHAAAERELAKLIHTLQGTVDETVYQLIERSARHGDSEAMAMIAELYDRGEYVEKDPQKCREWIWKAAESCCADACNWYALELMGRKRDEALPDGVQSYNLKDINPISLYWMLRGYRLGDTRLFEQFATEDDYIDGMPDVVKITQRAADAGEPQAMTEYGIYLCTEEIDKAKGYEYIQKAADLGNSSGKIYLSTKYERDGDYSKSVEVYRKYSEEGNSQAMERLSLCYLNGLGVEKDIDKALYWSDRALSSGDQTGVSGVFSFFHVMYRIWENDRENPLTLARTVNSAWDAAKFGDPYASYFLKTQLEEKEKENESSPDNE